MFIRSVVSTRFWFVVLIAMLFSPCNPAHAGWRAGVARVEITPKQPMWMSGYAARKGPAEGTLHPLWAKAIYLQPEEGPALLMVTLDLVGVGRDLSLKIRDQLQQDAGLTRAQVALCSSHTHTGPVVGENLRTMYFIDERQQRLIDEYTERLIASVREAARLARKQMQSVEIFYASGKATFAVNRRNNREADVPRLREEGELVGPMDHDVPVLKVVDDSGEVIAVLFGYACHATVLSFNQWSGDWPGFAQIEIEKAFPGAIAMFWAGCGADQNPLPRRKVEYAENYGRQIREAVRKVLEEDMSALPGVTTTGYREIELEFDHVPNTEELRAQEQSENRYVASRAKYLQRKLAEEGKLASKYPYPIQVWTFGDELAFVILGGEVVVDYSLRLKAELKGPHVWVAGYSNDVMAYIPSERVLMEGGYEGERAMIYYGLPSKWKAGLEERIVETVIELESSKQ